MSTQYDAMKARESKSIFNTYGRYPLAVSRAQGSRMWDLDGNAYVDLLAGIAVANLGHSRPELAQVMSEQAQKLVHVSNLFTQEEQIILAEKLLATCHAGKVFFSNSGAESNEGAIKLARRYMQKVLKRDAYEIITLEGSFHGRTLATIAATGQAKFQDGFAPIPQGFVMAPWDDLAGLEKMITPKTAAIMVEIVQGEGGVRPMSPAYAQGIAELCRKHNVLLIADEIQAGLCRTGKFWAFQHHNLEPDIFTTSKALANGLPMGALLATDEVAQGFIPGTHATTFGGGGVLSAVASKVIDIMNEDALAERAQEMGAYAMDKFEKLRKQYPDHIDHVRGLGLMLGIVLKYSAQDVWKKLFEKRFILNCTQETVLRLLPPLTVEKDDIDSFTTALADILEETQKA